MTVDADRVVTVARALVREARAEQLTFLAGSIAYHAFVSLLPLLLLLVLVLSALGELAPTEAVFTVVGAAFTEGAADVLLGELRRTSRSRRLSLVGGLVLVWGTLRVFRGLDTAFSDVYETEAANGFLDQVRDGFVVSVAFALAVVVAGTVASAIPGDGAGPGWLLVNRLALVVGLTLTLWPMYYVFPDTDVTAREVLPGTAFAAVGLTVFVSLFGVYVDWSGEQPDESVLAAILVFLTWLYVSGLVVLLGVALNAVLSNRSEDVSIDPVFGDAGTTATARRDRLATELAAVDRLFADPGSFGIARGDDRVDLPAPDSVTVTDEASATDDADTEFAVEFRWHASASASSGSGADDESA
ncbi:YihY/virulence factor BrkB family protein [Halobaculum sp. MBLA0147]|uniref:YihY/virulence factor BrkB family protein n=1 Tax=Halobaculum sp. MBLA0147 TaxID=3079934 RepID=UPI0035266C4E